jgi:hypothetical protein
LPTSIACRRNSPQRKYWIFNGLFPELLISNVIN